MASNKNSHNERALEALLRHIERERDRRREEILDAAREQATELVRESLRKARARVQETIDEQRRECDSRVRAARAGEESRLRRRQHEVVRSLLDEAWPVLQTQLVRRWQRSEGRRAWLAMTLASAARHLPAGTWKIEHPGDPLPGESESPLADLYRQRSDVELEWVANDELEAGLRIRVNRASLDTTTAALLGQRSEAEGLLLGQLLVRGDQSVRKLVTGSGE